MTLTVEPEPHMDNEQYPPRWPYNPEQVAEAAANAPIWPIATEQESSADPVLIRMARGAGNLALLGLVAFELSPLNEISRIAAAGTVGTLTGSPELAAATFAVSSFVVEGGGALATSHLLGTEHGDWVIRRANRLLGNLAGRQMHTNGAVDFGISMIAGVPTALVIKQSLDPSRTVADNIRDGMRLTATTSVVLGGEGYAVARGIAKAGSLPVISGVAGLGLGVAVGTKRWIGERLAQTSPFSYATYEKLAQHQGPQLEGYQEQDYQAIIADPATKYLSIKHGKNKGQWPVLANIHHNTEYADGYFSGRENGQYSTYYLSLPPRELLLDSKVQRQLADILYDVLQSGATVVFDQLVGEENNLVYIRDIIRAHYPDVATDMLHVDEFVDPKNSSPAEVAHFQGLAAAKGDMGERVDPNTQAVTLMRAEYHRLVENGEIDLMRDRKTIVIDPSALDSPVNGASAQTVLERLWEIYNGRFDTLVEGFPVRGEQTFDEFASLIRKETTLIVAQLNGGQIAAFTYISDVKDCEWLNQAYFAGRYPNEPTVYFPGIAADKEAEGRSSLHLIKLMGRLMTNTVGRVRIVWQCTNASKDYVPAIVRAGIELSGNMKLAEPITQSASYRYFGLTLTPPGK